MPPKKRCRFATRILQRSNGAYRLQLQRRWLTPLDRLSPPPPPMVDSTQGSNALGFFHCASPARIIRRRDLPRSRNLMAGLKKSARKASTDRSPRRAVGARGRASVQPLSETDYLKKILTARVYDVAHETALEPARRLSARTGNQVLLKREDTQPVFSFKLRGAYNKMSLLSSRPARPRRDLRIRRQPCARRCACGPPPRLHRIDRDAGHHADFEDRRRQGTWRAPWSCTAKASPMPTAMPSSWRNSAA